jgi:hypothetical protein
VGLSYGERKGVGELLDASFSRDRRQLEQQLLERARAAQKAYQVASAEYSQVFNEWAGLLDEPIAAAALHRAASNQTLAIESYARAFRAVADLIVDGRIPEA